MSSTDQDITDLADIVSRGINKGIELGITDGLKLKAALGRVTKEKRGTDAAKAVIRQLCCTNPVLASQIEAAAAGSPVVAAFAARLGILPKDAGEAP
jgi:hypothetical protein